MHLPAKLELAFSGRTNQYPSFPRVISYRLCFPYITVNAVTLWSLTSKAGGMGDLASNRSRWQIPINQPMPHTPAELQASPYGF